MTLQEAPDLTVPGERIELPTNGLQNRCSTAELTRQINGLDLPDRAIATGLPPENIATRSYSGLFENQAAEQGGDRNDPKWDQIVIAVGDRL